MEEPTNKINDALKWHFFNLYCMALSDNEFDFTERQALYQIGIKHGIAPEQINEFVLTANLKPVVPEAMNGKVECLYELTQMAWADGQITPEENQTIKKCVIRYGFLKENAERIVDYFIESVKVNKTQEEVLNEING
ncbi:MAG: hypothetical protein KBS99_04810 [Prevotellaceae bacterium]|nr:hypothetical protein [Candidatus Colivivens caballi]